MNIKKIEKLTQMLFRELVSNGITGELKCKGNTEKNSVFEMKIIITELKEKKGGKK